MTSPIVEVSGVYKKYRLGEEGSSRVRRRKTSDLLRSFLDRFRSGRIDPLQLGPDEFWALKDVSFQVYPGQVLGIIGRNGSGKSTLLRILSRITSPTAGRIRVCGQVASLLEIGTGFNPELTGRENIFLNGTILGMSHREIKRKFDKIVDFSGVEKFLDTPVKFYSSGMYARLAFSVAAHLDSDILLIDEVLAVGDAQFQQKSLARMREMTSKEGRTVIYVSHNLVSVEELCHQTVLLENGATWQVGETSEVVNIYRRMMGIEGPKEELSKPRPAAREITFRNWQKVRGDETLRVDYPLTKNSLVFDVGGYKGSWSSDIFSRYQCQIYVFEPVKCFYRVIKKRFRNNKNIHVFGYGLAATTGEGRMKVAADGSTLLRVESEGEVVKLVDIVEFIKSHGVKQIDLLEINAEGAEYELLERLIATKVISMVKDIQVQFHLLIPDAKKRRANIQREFKRTHRPTYNFPFVWENWTRI